MSCPVFSFLLGISFFAGINTTCAQIGIFEGQADVGNVALKGQALWSPAAQEYQLRGSGTNMWFGHDEFHFVWKKMKGDFIIRANAAFTGKGVEAHRKLGCMIRASLDSDATQVNAVVHGDGLTSLQF